MTDVEKIGVLGIYAIYTSIHHRYSKCKEHRVDCSGRHLTPAGNRGKVETPQGKPEEARLPPRGMLCL